MLKHFSISGIVFGLVAYLALAIGPISLHSNILISIFIVLSIFALSLSILMSGRVSLPIGYIVCFCVTASFLLFQLGRTSNVAVAVSKLDSVLVSSVVCYTLILGSIHIYSEKALPNFILAGLVVLVLTVFYKSYFGFWDRSVRFFLNGPIVFAWLMGLCCLISLQIALWHGRFRWIVLSSFFYIAALWTQSKGPVLLVTGCIPLLLAMNRMAFWTAAVTILAITCLFFSYIMGIIPSRFLAIERAIQGGLEEGDFGSIGTRQWMWQESWEMFLNNPVIGVGLGSWGQNVSDGLREFGFIYPHNFPLEVLSEHGAVGGILFFSLLVFILAASNGIGRILVVYSLGIMQFSGDMSYWHLLVAFGLATSRTKLVSRNK